MTKRQRLIQTLQALTPKALDDIEASLDRDTPILCGQWWDSSTDVRCGCLMMDGHVEEYLLSDHRDLDPSGFLATKYGMTKNNESTFDEVDRCFTTPIQKAAFAFDRWVDGIYRKRDEYIKSDVLSSRGRREMKKIMAQVRA